MLVKTKFRFLFIVAVLAAIIFSTCETPMGMGDPIDWEAPVVTLDPGPNPRYVRNGTTIGGTVTDNIGVERIIMRDADTGKEYLRGTLIKPDRFVFNLNFNEANNGQKMTVEIVAFDRLGNAGVESTKIFIDLRGPVVESAWIERATSRLEYLKEYNNLKELENTLDKLGEKSDYKNSYQNGWFYFAATLVENETRVEKLVLNIYDANNLPSPDNNKPLLTLEERDPTSSINAPKWIIKEEELISKGNARYGQSYSTDYYLNKKRYYYYVSLSVYDKSENMGTLEERVENQKYFCMWEKADEPKGIIDPIIGNTIYKRMTIPVQLFDDDSLKYAWVGLITKKQWNGEEAIFDSNVKIPTGITNEDRMTYLYNRLVVSNLGVYNWKFDSKFQTSHASDADNGNRQKVKDYINGVTNIDDQLANIDTGTKDTDYGEYVLFTICGDTKLSPHTNSGNTDTLIPRYKTRYYEINIIDDNMPLIVLDTVNTTADGYDASKHEGSTIKEPIVAAQTGNSPEENTFPKLASDGKTFEINGYTLREKGGSTGTNRVQRFRMAWVPQSLLSPETEKTVLKQVENALRWYKDPYEPEMQNKPENSFPDGVQYWIMDDAAYASSQSPSYTPDAPITNGTDVTISSSTYVKQVFRKKFSVLGDIDDKKGGVPNNYKNFTYNNVRENETKVFIFCAIDNMQKEVFRTIRLLPNKTPPDLNIYDITARTFALANPPNVYTYDSAGNITDAYITARQTFNNSAYNTLKSVIGTLLPENLTTSVQKYTRKSTVKFFVTAAKSGDLAIQNITMQDVTNSGTPIPIGSTFNSADSSLSYIEYFPEVASRVFLFTATDSLGNVRQIQRTISITNAATLIDITTESLSATYGIGKTITLKANFDGRIIVDGAFSDVRLNIRYPKTKTPNSLNENDYNFVQIPLARQKTLSLEFDFVVSEDDVGMLETLYDSAAMYFTHTDMNRPISLENNAKIMDVNRGDEAFTPGNAAGFTWTSVAWSLQDQKTITLDGVRPRINGLTVSGKTPYNGNYYFKAGETLLFTVTADKDIRTASTAPTLSYRLNGTGTSNDAAFKYQSPKGTNGVVFALQIDRTSCPNDGEINEFRLYDLGTIVDDAGNSIKNTSATVAALSGYLGTIKIYNDQTPPLKPPTALSVAPSTPTTNANPANDVGRFPDTVWNYRTVPQVTINEPGGEPSWSGQTLQYSFDGGISWSDYSAPTAVKNDAEYTLQTRSTDRAGNIGPVTEQKMKVNAKFPKITSVGVDQAKGTYTAQAGQNRLTFVLNFENSVRVTTQANVTITVTNRNNSNSNNDGGVNTPDSSYQYKLTADDGQTTNTQNIKFTWTTLAANTKEMLDGLYISAITITGLTDQFGNVGGAATSSSPSAGNANVISVTVNANDGTGNYTVSNLPAGYIVDTIAPKVVTLNPALQADISDANRKIITLTFNEPMMGGSGLITVKPASNSLIPPVFENDGYYLGTDGIRYTSPGTNRTYVDGFYDIYNNGNLEAADKNALTESTSSTSPSWGTLKLNPRTGQTTGPYQRITQGLKIGSGYSGDYANAGENAPNPATGGTGNDRFLIPDTATKWVLDYKLYINDTTADGTVDKINKVLKKAKFRWQEIDVANTAVSGNTVTITLNEPLLPGLHWELSYPAGVFTDKAGNNAPALASHEFWSPGAQVPVIRVNRRSYDARPVGGNATTPGSLESSTGGYGTPPQATNWTATTAVTDVNGWGFTDFNTVLYRIETETPGATLSSGLYGGTNATRVTNKSGVTAAFSTTAYVQTANASNNVSGVTNTLWTTTTQTNGAWILTNLIRRANSSYTINENGNTVTRTYSGEYSGFRSYNKDATIANINGVTPLTAFSATGNQGSISFNDLEAGKAYIVATATRGGATSTRGYEGVFRTVIALYNNGGNYANSGANRAVYVEGSNVKNGMPSVAGFPVQDAAESGDARFIKMFYKYSGTNNAQLVWVSTEIVCEWYFLKWGGQGNGSTHMRDGEVNNYLTVGYGDLSYGYNLRSSND